VPSSPHTAPVRLTALCSYSHRDARSPRSANERNAQQSIDGFPSAQISPRTSTVIFLGEVAAAIAVATSAMFAAWAVRFDAI